MYRSISSTLLVPFPVPFTLHSEAQIEVCVVINLALFSYGVEVFFVNLEDLYCKYLDTCTKISKKIPDEHEVGDLKSTKKVHLDHSGNHEKSGYKVKIDEVEFADKRLQDNSYRAKSGAEIGYGAKEQQVLGQVRGRYACYQHSTHKRVKLNVFPFILYYLLNR
ncbi:hypothetical protein DCAR_0933372 [Daucus carota subsp. sativus]|uniref:Srp40 C-terminal domain-containing protein n=1 Tax=Daucus carota subsp. sativus TaxID=79200 RepID=A0AAF0XTH2_DAUCS|nr:hypothetical protein DCAR_0933372 [Daucus carota subsp. sativus]